MNSFFIQLKEGRIHCLEAGSGPGLVVCFHGYSRDAATFLPMAAHLEGRYTLVSVDLPHHGGTEWPDALPLRRAGLIEIMAALQARYGLARMALAGFSLGGRVALTVLEEIPDKISGMVLAASDALQPNPVYRFAMRTAAGRKLFADLLRRPERYLRLMQRLARQRVLPGLHYEWAANYIQAPWTRTLLGKVWPSLRYLVPSVRRVQSVLRRYKVPLQLFMGRHDTVVPLRYAERFCAGAPGVRLTVLEKGHRLLDNETLRQMAAALP